MIEIERVLGFCETNYFYTTRNLHRVDAKFDKSISPGYFNKRAVSVSIT